MFEMLLGFLLNQISDRGTRADCGSRASKARSPTLSFQAIEVCVGPRKHEECKFIRVFSDLLLTEDLAVQ
jgi:hypothetical protein